MRLVLIRHVSTEANKNGVLCGRTESPVEDNSWKQIDRIKDILTVYSIGKESSDIKVYSSPSKRTLYTASEVFDVCESQIKSVDDLMETDFGKFEGMSFSDIEKEFPEEYSKLVSEGIDYRFPKGESVEDTYNRISDFIKSIISEKSDETVFIVSHGGAIRCIISYLMDRDYSTHWKYRIDNGSVSMIEYYDGFSVLSCLNVK